VWAVWVEMVMTFPPGLGFLEEEPTAAPDTCRSVAGPVLRG
jgi:hypothetical protein